MRDSGRTCAAAGAVIVDLGLGGGRGQVRGRGGHGGRGGRPDPAAVDDHAPIEEGLEEVGSTNDGAGYQ